MSEASSFQYPKLELNSYDMSEVADKLQSLHLQDHDKIKTPPRWRSSRAARIRIRVRRRRRLVRFRVSPLLGYLRGLLQSASTAMDRSRRRLSRCKRARRIHSVQGSNYEPDEQVQPLLNYMPDS